MTDKVDVILFDVGGVLTCDPWPALLLTAEYGIADVHGIDHDVVAEVAEKLWPKYSTKPLSEAGYWNDFGEAVGRAVDQNALVALEERVLVVNPDGVEAVRSAARRGLRVGLITDNTAFWLEKQIRRTGLSSEITEDLIFTSFHYGVSKRAEGRNLFSIAAGVVDPSRTIVVDDREVNINQAAALGFKTVRYFMGDRVPSLTARINSQL